MKSKLYVSLPYGEVCLNCGCRGNVVAIHVPTDLGTGMVRSTRLCWDCLTFFTQLLSGRCRQLETVNRFR